MEFQNTINVLDDATNQTSKQEIGLKWMINHWEHIMPIVTLDLRLQWWRQIYIIIEIHTYTLKKL